MDPHRARETGLLTILQLAEAGAAVEGVATTDLSVPGAAEYGVWLPLTPAGPWPAHLCWAPPSLPPVVRL